MAEGILSRMEQQTTLSFSPDVVTTNNFHVIIDSIQHMLSLPLSFSTEPEFELDVQHEVEITNPIMQVDDTARTSKQYA